MHCDSLMIIGLHVSFSSHPVLGFVICASDIPDARWYKKINLTSKDTAEPCRKHSETYSLFKAGGKK